MKTLVKFPGHSVSTPRMDNCNDKDNLPAVNEKKGEKEGDERGQGHSEAFQARNWTFFKKNERQLKKLPPQVKSRYMAYEEPPKAIAEAQLSSRKRLVDLKNRYVRENKPPSELEIDDRDKHEKLIGQLKAAEARNRIRIMRLRYETNMGQEINHLTACQPTAGKAVRMQALLPTRPDRRPQGDSLDKISRGRVECLLEDTRGIMISRT
ncbi:hypothetical protein CAPTEDRAFT_220213 [Capitella teleta]|uniref:Uncharacterized protein n=1 Tax=Capitella teleta TaxID=283909 RepID=R7T5S6_CAPTE|nr:hypothetical protein CAPTEDRAFT_220213 [Capitella teleta]|eukprot:ELT88660.1 hypothetical protein CAPTEDRAFT_220213 [Capitella teleta]